MNKSLITALKAIGIAAASCAAIFVLLIAATMPGVLYNEEHSVYPTLIQTVSSDTPMSDVRLIRYKDVTIQEFDSLLALGLTNTIETEIVNSFSDDKGFTTASFFPQYRGVYLIQSISEGEKNGSVLLYFDEAWVNNLVENDLTIEHEHGYLISTQDGAIKINKDFQVCIHS